MSAAVVREFFVLLRTTIARKHNNWLFCLDMPAVLSTLNEVRTGEDQQNFSIWPGMFAGFISILG